MPVDLTSGGRPPVTSKKRERHRLNKIAGSPFRIVVCAYPDRTIDPVVPLLKAALLYGDEVVLHSPMASMLGAIAAVARNDHRTFMRFALEVGPTISAEFSAQIAGIDAAHGPDQGRKILAALFDPQSLERALLSKVAPELREQIAEFERDQLPGIRKELVDVSARQIADAGFGVLDAAFDAGVLRICQVDITADDLERTYLAELQALFSDPACYPVFDARMSDLVRVSVDARQLDIAGYTARRAPSATVSERFLSRLPTFPAATVDEVIGIRDELRGPLIRFRRELVQVVAEMQSRPWDAEFEHDVEAAWVGRVAPAVLEIDELSEAKRLIKHYGAEAAGTVVTAGSLFAGMNMITAGLVAARAGTVGGMAIAGASIAVKRRGTARTIALNPYFFLFDADRRLA